MIYREKDMRSYHSQKPKKPLKSHRVRDFLREHRNETVHSAKSEHFNDSMLTFKDSDLREIKKLVKETKPMNYRALKWKQLTIKKISNSHHRPSHKGKVKLSQQNLGNMWKLRSEVKLGRSMCAAGSHYFLPSDNTMNLSIVVTEVMKKETNNNYVVLQTLRENKNLSLNYSNGGLIPQCVKHSVIQNSNLSHENTQLKVPFLKKASIDQESVAMSLQNRSRDSTDNVSGNISDNISSNSAVSDDSADDMVIPATPYPQTIKQETESDGHANVSATPYQLAIKQETESDGQANVSVDTRSYVFGQFERRNNPGLDKVRTAEQLFHPKPIISSEPKSKQQNINQTPTTRTSNNQPSINHSEVYTHL